MSDERRFLIVSGLSGAGKSIALHALEDAGFYCVDNLPVGILTNFARFIADQNQPHFNKVAVGIDARDGLVAVQGWAETTDMHAVDLARAFEGCGVAAIIVTDIARDGLKTGVNVDLTGQLADAVSIPIIASGGLKNVGDITALKNRAGKPIAGAILGRALYDGDIDPAAALLAAR